MGVQRRPVRRADRQQIVVHAEMRGQFGRGKHRTVGYDDIAGTVVEDAYHRTVVHRTARKVAHAAVGTLAVEVATVQKGKRHAYRHHIADGRKLPDGVVDIFCNVYGYVAAVALSPAFLPQIACGLGNFLHLGGKFRTVCQYGFHILYKYYVFVVLFCIVRANVPATPCHRLPPCSEGQVLSADGAHDAVSLLRHRHHNDRRYEQQKPCHEHCGCLFAASAPLFQDDAPDVAEHHIERHEYAP